VLPEPLLDCGALAGACKPPWSLDELLLDPVDDPSDPLDDPLDEPWLPDDELPDDELVPVPELFTDVWVAPGRPAATAPATATLARVTVTVVAFSRRLPCSRSATARATWRPLLTDSSRLFTSISVTPLAVSAVEGLSQNALSAPCRSRHADRAMPSAPSGGALRDRLELPIFSNAQRRLHYCFPHGRAPRGA
jgi:hypothetical protein